VKVDEKGTEAAGATAVVAVAGAGAPHPVPAFNADHPFLWMIVDKASGLVLFMGRVADPGSKS
jgi:serpin B